MSQEIDRRIVEMRFDNAQFERGIHQSMKSLDEFEKSLQLENSAKGFETLGSAADKLAGNGLSKVTYATEEVKHEFSAMEAVAFSALQNITNKAINAGEKLLKSLTIDQVAAGYSKYEEKVKAVQTIMASTGGDIDSVSSSLEKLNWYTDETSASFSDMINNIGKFTSNNIDLDTAIAATEGISNWAMVSGQNNSTAARAYYNLAQALSVGSIQLIDWKSIQNANMATTEFKQTVLDTATDMGMLQEVSEGVYETTSKTAKAGKQVTNMDFTSALTDSKWFSSDVLLSTLKKYGDFSDKLNEATEATGLSASEMIQALEQFKAIDTGEMTESDWIKEWANNDDLTSFELLTDYMEEFAYATDESGRSLYELGVKSFKAAQEAKTFSDAGSAIKDAVSTQFMNLYEIIFGNYEEAKRLWTDVANWGYDVFAEPLNKLNEFSDLVFGSTSNHLDDLRNVLEGFGLSSEVFDKSFNKIMSSATGATEVMEFSSQEINDILQAGLLDGTTLSAIIDDALGDTGLSVEKAKETAKSFEEVKSVVYDIIRGDYGNSPARKNLLEEAGYDYEKYQALVNKVWNGGSYDGEITADDIADMNDEVLTAIGLTEQQITMIREFSDAAANGDKQIQELLDSLTGMSGRDMLSATLHNIMDTIENLVKIGSNVWNILFPRSKVSMAKNALAVVMQATEYIKNLTSDTMGIAQNIAYILTPIINTGKLIGQLFGKGFEIVRAVLMSLKDALPESNLDFLEKFADGANDLYYILSGLIDMIDANKIADKVKDTIKWIKKLFSNIKGFFKMDDMKSIGEWSLEGFVEGIKNGAKEAWNSVVDFFKEVVERVKNFLGIHSPSTIFIAIGAFVILGFIKGIKDKLPKLENAFGLIFDLIKAVVAGYKEYFIDKAFTEEGSKFEVFFGKVVLATELLKTKVKNNLQKAGESFKKFAGNLKSSNYIFSFFGDYIDWVKRIYAQNNGSLWDTFWETMSFSKDYYNVNRNLTLDKLAEFWKTSVRTDAFNNWLNKSMKDGSVVANSIGQLVYIVETILRKDMPLFDKVKEISRSFEDFHPLIDYLNTQIQSVFETLWNNFDLILQIGKLAVLIKKLTYVTNMYDSIAFFFNDAKGVTTALKTAIESWSNPLARTGTITKKLSKSQAFFEIAKGIALIGASVWLIVKSFENVYNLVASADQAALIKTEGVIFGILGGLEVIILTIGIFTELISHSELASLSGSVALNSIATAIKWLAIIIGEITVLSYFATKLSTGTLIAMGATLVALTVVGVVLARSCQKLLGVAKDLTETQLLKTSGVFIGMMGFIVAFATLAVGLGILFAIKPGMIGYVIGSMILLLGAIAALLGIVYKFMKSTKGLDMIDASWLSVGVSNILLSLVAVIAALAAAVIVLTLVIGDDWQKGAVAALALIGLSAASYALLKASGTFIIRLSKALKDVKEDDIKNLKKTMIPVMIFVGGLIVALTAATVVLMKSINGTNNGMRTFALVLGGITAAIFVILRAIGFFIKSVVEATKDADLNKEKEMAKVFDSLTKVFLSIGAMIIMLGSALYIVTAAFNSSDTKSGETNNAWKAMIAIGAILVVIGAVTYILIRSLKKVSVNTDLTKYTNNVLKIMGGMIALISVIAGSLWLLTYMNPNQLKTAAITMGAILAVAVIIIMILIRSIKKTMNKTSVFNKDEMSKTESVADQLLKMVLAMSAMIGVISIALYAVSQVKREDLVRSAIVIGALMGGVMLFIWALTKLTKESGIIKDADTGKGTKFNKVIKTVIPIIIGIVALCIAAIVLGGMDRNSLFQGVAAIAILGTVIAAILGAVALMFKNKTPNTSKWKRLGAIAMIITIVAGIVVLAKAVQQLSETYNTNTWAAFGVIAAVAGVISGVFLLLTLFSKIKTVGGNGVGWKQMLLVATVCGGIWLIADAIRKIGIEYDKGHMWKAFGVISAISGVILFIVGLFAAFPLLASVGGPIGAAVGGLSAAITGTLGALFIGIGGVIAAIVAAIGYLIGNVERFMEFFEREPGMFDSATENTEESSDRFMSMVSTKTSQIVQKLILFVQSVVAGIKDGLEQSKDSIGDIINTVTEIITMLADLISTDPGLTVALKNFGEAIGYKLSTLLYNAIHGAITGALRGLLFSAGGAIWKPFMKYVLKMKDSEIEELYAVASETYSKYGLSPIIQMGRWPMLINYDTEPIKKPDTQILERDAAAARAKAEAAKTAEADQIAKAKAEAKDATTEEGVQEAVDEYNETNAAESGKTGGFFSNLWTGAKNFFGGKEDNSISAIIDLIDSIKGINMEDLMSSIDMASMLDTLQSGGDNGALSIISGFIKGLDQSKQEEIEKAMENVFGDTETGAVGQLREILGWHSPAQVTVNAAKDCIEGFIFGLNDSDKLSALDAAVSNTADRIITTFSGALAASEFVNYTPTITPVLDFSTYDSQIASVNAAFFAPKLSLNGKAIGEVGNMSGTITVVNDNRDIVNAVHSLNAKMDQVTREINNMQVILDSGALVGSITTKMNLSLGTKNKENLRGSLG